MVKNNPDNHNDLTNQWPESHTALDALESYVSMKITSQANTTTNETAPDVDDNTSQQSHNPQTLPSMVTPSLGTSAKWDAFYLDHVKFLQEWYPDLLTMNTMVPMDDYLTDCHKQPICTDCPSASSTSDNHFQNTANIAMADDAEVLSTSQPSVKCNHYAVQNTNDNQLQLQHHPTPTQQSPKIYCAPPTVNYCPVAKIATVCLATESANQTNDNQLLGLLPLWSNKIQADIQNQTLQKILALLDELNVLIICLLQQVSRPAPSNSPLCDLQDPLTQFNQPATITRLHKTSLCNPLPPGQ